MCMQQQLIEYLYPILALQVAASAMQSTKTQALQVVGHEQVLCNQVLASAAMVDWQLRQLDWLCCRNTCKLQLPAFTSHTGSTSITLFGVYVVKRFGRDQHKDRFNRRAEFHLLYCKLPRLCNTCDCPGRTLCTCLDNGALWDKFLRDTGRCIPNKAQVPAALDAWRVWGQHAGFSLRQQELSCVLCAHV